MKVLFLTHRLPYAPNRGDRVRAYHIVRRLAEHADLDVLSPPHEREELSKVDTMRKQGLNVTAALVPALRNHATAMFSLLGTRPLSHLLLDAPGITSSIRRLVGDRRPDVVLAYC